jgi:hypothetical protein
VERSTALAKAPYELWAAFVVSLVPQVTALFGGGYGAIITNTPLALGLIVIDVAAVAIAYLQHREDAKANRASHWLVSATIVAGGIWLLYAVAMGLVLILGNVFCVNRLCRGPLR